MLPYALDKGQVLEKYTKNFEYNEKMVTLLHNAEAEDRIAALASVDYIHAKYN